MPSFQVRAFGWFMRLVCSTAASVLPLAPLAAGEQVVVVLLDGRSTHGDVDARTDAERLWLRREIPGVQLASGFAWDQVKTVRAAGQSYAGRDFLPIAGAIASEGKSYLRIEPYRQPPSATLAPEAPVNERVNRQPAGAPPRLPGFEPSPEPQANEQLRRRHAEQRVKSLMVEAYLAQWDGDPQPDGLRVFVYPLSADGEIVPVNGQVDLSLLGEIEKVGSLPDFRELDRGHFTLRKDDFARGPGVVELPFRQFHPDVNFDVARQAVLHARLGVNGQGVFEASDANVQLRGFSRIRDQLQMFQRRRYFGEENAIPPLH